MLVAEFAWQEIVCFPELVRWEAAHSRHIPDQGSPVLGSQLMEDLVYADMQRLRWKMKSLKTQVSVVEGSISPWAGDRGFVLALALAKPSVFLP